MENLSYEKKHGIKIEKTARIAEIICYSDKERTQEVERFETYVGVKKFLNIQTVGKSLDIASEKGSLSRGYYWRVNKIENENITKRKTDSWVDIESNEANFLGRKTADYSIFNHGTTIPGRYHKKFLDNLSQKVELGSNVKIKLLLNDKEYNAVIDSPNSKGRKDIPIRLLFRDKSLKEQLQKELEVSYDFIMEYFKEYDKTPNINNIPDNYKQYIDFYKDDEKDIFILKLIVNIDEESEEIEEEEILDLINEDEEIRQQEEVEDEFYPIGDIKGEVDFIHQYITAQGFYYSKSLINNFYISLKTKPFVILSGISGTGKSKIVELFAEAIGANYSNKRFNLIPVRPDWSDATDLLGYRNIENKFVPGVISLIAYEAMKNPDKPYFICLDEMNLARVEYYFSDILSLMETRRLNGDNEIITEKLLSKEQFGRDERAFDKYGDVYIPQNLYIVGTVNMDETTFPFSKKVLDRANTIEFNKVDLDYDFDSITFEEVEPRIYHNDLLKAEYLKLSQCASHKDIAKQVIDELIKINSILEKHNQHFGYRVRDEIVFYMIYAVSNDLMSFEEGFDNCIVQKILPKIGGSNNDVLEILIAIYNLLNSKKVDYNDCYDDNVIRGLENEISNSNYKLSNEKLIFMIRRFVRDGFTTFWQ